MQMFDVDYPALLYLSPEFAQMLSFSSWKFSKQCNVIVIVIPRSVWRNLTSINLGVFRKILPKFKHIACEK